MPEREQFLAAIRQAPDDDAPRLIYADWLDDQGETTRADFIRFGVAAGEWGPNRHNNNKMFHTGAARRLGLDVRHPYFRRGFLDEFEVVPRNTLAALAVWSSEPLASDRADRYSGEGVVDARAAFAERADSESLTLLLPTDEWLMGRLRSNRLSFRCWDLRIEYVANEISQPSIAGPDFPHVRRLTITDAQPATLGRIFRQFDDRSLDLTLIDDENEPTRRPALTWPAHIRTLDLERWDPFTVRRLLVASELPPARGIALQVGRSQRRDVLAALARWPGATVLERLTLVWGGDGGDGRFLDAIGRLLPAVSVLRVEVRGEFRDGHAFDPAAWPTLREAAFDFGFNDELKLFINSFAPLAASLDSLEFTGSPFGLFEAPVWQSATALRRLKLGSVDEKSSAASHRCWGWPG